MKALFAFALLYFAMLVFSPAVLAVSVDPADPNVQYTGRWNFDNRSQPQVSWQGSSVKIRFDGTGVRADFKGGGGKEFYRVIVDGVAREELILTRRKRVNVVLADNLPSGVHTVELMRETFYTSAMTFYGFEVTGTVLSPPVRPSLRIEFLGDSNMDGSSLYSEKNSGESGTYFAYPAMTSRMLDAEMNLQAVGGATLDNGGDNDVRSFIFSEDYYNQDANYRSGFDPHVIVVNAGANDVGAGKEKIKQRYKDVIADLRSVYGSQPHIVLMNAYGWDLNEPANYSQEVVDEVGGNLSVMLFPWLWEQWHGCQWDHSGQAHMLAGYIASLDSSWAIKNTNDIIDGFGRNGDFANGSFEHEAPFGGFGWRYHEDGVQRVYDPAGAVDGDYYIRLGASQQVHQPIDATADFLPGGAAGGETYTITAQIRSNSGTAVARISTHFEGQQLYTHDDDPSKFQTSTFNVDGIWQEYTHVFTVPAGTWTLFNYFSSSSGTVEIDNVRMAPGGQQPTNNAPSANFSASPNNLQVDFTDLSTDSDGTITGWLWGFGDDSGSSQRDPSHSYATAGTYTVSLTATDDDGASDSASSTVTVTEPPGGADLVLSISSATKNRKNRLTVNLAWSGAVGINVDVLLAGNAVAATANDGAYRYTQNKAQGNTFIFQVCETGDGACSNQETVEF